MCQSMSPKIHRSITIPGAIDDKPRDETVVSDVTTISTDNDEDSRCSCETRMKPCTRQVRFDDDIVIHKETGVMSKAEFRAYYMQLHDLERCHMDVKETIKKWLRHFGGRTTFDDERFTIRGLEGLLDHLKHMNCMTKSRASLKDQHCKAVLKEYIRQTRVASSFSSRNLEEKVRAISERFSAAALKRAIKLGENDALHVASLSSSPLGGARFNSDPILRLSRPVKAIDCRECARPIQRSKKERGVLSFLKKRSSRSPCEDEVYV
jgi:hypothetical protein